MKAGGSKGPSAIELIEESVQLLRRVPPGALAIYYAGTAPFALGMIFFWARTTWFRPSDAAVAWAALGLVGLFAAMKVAHAEFCARLLALRVGDVPPTWSMGRAAAMAVSQLRWHAWGITAIPAALVMTVPFGWTYAFFQSVTVIGASERLGGDAAKQAQLWPMQNHIALVFLSVFAAVIWVNVAVACWMVPWLANRLLGIENIFGFSGWWFLNTTFLAATVAITWLAFDPLVKAFYTLRVFYGRARRDGEDLRVELRHARVQRGGAARRMAAVAIAVMAAGIFWVTPRASGADADAADVRNDRNGVEIVQLDRAIDEVLAGSAFEWRLRPMPRAENLERAQESWAKGVLRYAAEWVRDLVRAGVDRWRQFRRWMSDLFPEAPAGSVGKGAALGWAAMQALLWVVMVAVVALILSVIVLAWRRSRGLRRPAMAAKAVEVAAPDLSDEATQAGQLPTERWLELAREQLARGDWRLALRALYLATLARLAAEGLVSLARFKTNLDYERELHRRALLQQDVVSWFSARRRAFEDVWYGRGAAGEAAVREWLAELERRASA